MPAYVVIINVSLQMYRKMQASEPTIMNNTMPHLECVDKVTKLPVVEMLVNQTSELYDKVKVCRP
jgi:hypothetical protein